MINYTLSIWTHDDNHLYDLRALHDFKGQAYNTKLKTKVNGQEELSFSLPLFIFNEEIGKHEENPAWYLIKNERKIRLIRKKGEPEQSIHDFVIKKYVERRDGFEKILEIECQGYALFELSKIGFTGVFSESSLEENGQIVKGNIDFWAGKILELTKNKYSATNTSGWTFDVDTEDGILYEEENIVGFEQSGSDWVPVYATDGVGNLIKLEKERIIKSEKSNVFNLLQEVAEKFQVWAHFEYSYNEAFQTIGRKISFKKEVELEAPYTINYGVNSDKISREYDSDDLITKMYVEPVVSEFEDDGIMSISKAPQNLTMEDFLYNFDYLYSEGFMSAQEYADSKAYQNELRSFNIQYRPKSLNLIAKQNEIDTLTGELDFIDYEISAAEEVVRRLSNEIAIHPIGAVSVTDMVFVVIQRNGQFFADLSIKKGVKQGSFTIKKFNYASAGVSIAQYIMMDDDPTCVKEIRFSANPDPATNRVRLSFYHYPLLYIDKIIANENSKISSLNKKKSTIQNKINTLTSQISTLQLEINTLLANKQSLIDSFETEHKTLIKEGSWRNSSYILRKTRETLSNITIQHSDTSTTGYVLTKNLNDIDLKSIRLWTSDYEYEYFPVADFNVQYGTVSGVNRLLLIPENTGAFFTNKLTVGSTTRDNNASLKIKYRTLSGIDVSTEVSRTNCVVWQRYFDIPYENILPATLSIHPTSTSEKLERNLDYTYQVFENYSRVSLLAKGRAFHLSSYNRVIFETNNTVRFFYADAKDILDRSSKPKVTYDVKFIDISGLEGMESFQPKTGQKVLIKDPELFSEAVYGFISEIDYDLEIEENNEIQISNYTTKFEDLFQRIVATSETLSARADSYEKAAALVAPTGFINGDILQQSFLNNYITFTAGLNNEVFWGREGLTLTDSSGIQAVPPQVKIVGNGIFLSNSLGPTGRREWRTGITGSGINAAMLTTGAIDTKSISIWGSNEPRFLWNEDGITAYAINPSNGDTIFNTFVRYNHEGLKFQREFWDGETQILTTELSLTWEGLRIGAQRDSVIITSEKGFQVIDNNQLERVQIGRLFNDGVETNDFGVRIKNIDGITVFETDSNGDLTITGTITAGAGNLAGWILSSNEIYKGSGSTKIALNSTTPKIYVGTGNYNNTNTAFYVDDQGQFSLKDKLFFDSSNLTISGTVNATAGNFSNIVTIGGMGASGTLKVGSGANKINIVGNITDASTYISSGNTSALAGNGFYLGANGKVRIASATDSLIFDGSSLSITGTINAQGGSFTNQVYVGSAAGSRIVIDGTNLRLSSDGYQSGVRGWAINGDGSAEFENVDVRGSIKSTVFTYDEINAQGGSLMVAPSGVLYEEINRTLAENDVFTIKVSKPYLGYPGVFNIGDTLRIRTHVLSGSIVNLWLKIEPLGIDNTPVDYINYTVKVLPNSTVGNLTISNEMAIPTGTAIVDYRKLANGMILLEANDLTNGPFIDIIENKGNDLYLPNSQSARVRLGNLSGITDTNFDGGLQGYGLYAENAYLTGSIALPNAGITNLGDSNSDVRIWAGSTMASRGTAPFRVQQDGSMIIGNGQMVFDATNDTIALGPGVKMTWGSISNPPTIPDSYEVIISGNHIFPGETETVLSVKIYKNGEDITSSVDGASLTWKMNETTIVSTDPTNKTLTVTENNIHQVGNISCSYTW